MRHQQVTGVDGNVITVRFGASTAGRSAPASPFDADHPAIRAAAERLGMDAVAYVTAYRAARQAARTAAQRRDRPAL